MKIDIPYASDDVLQRNESKPIGKALDRCLICHSPVVNPKWAVTLVDGNGWIGTLDEVEQYEDAGTFIVGSDCIKKVPAEYRIKLEASK